jgi:hypothetical protein
MGFEQQVRDLVRSALAPSFARGSAAPERMTHEPLEGAEEIAT